jgi:hypothetical protein
MFSDSEFLLLYVIYFLLFIGLLCGTIYAVEYKKRFRNNLIFFVVYAAITFIPTLFPENMKYGASLIYLVGGWFFLALHIVVFAASLGWRYFQKKVK